VLKDITEGRDIVDLLRVKKIEITSKGSGIQRVSVSVRRRVPYQITDQAEMFYQITFQPQNPTERLVQFHRSHRSHGIPESFLCERRRYTRCEDSRGIV